LIDIQSGKTVSPLLQGFSNNIGKEGICLSAKNIDPAYLASIRNKQVKLSLKIQLPFKTKAVESLAGIAWLKEIPDESGFYSIGLHYEQIDSKDSGSILRFARLRSLFKPVMLSTLALLLAFLILGSYFNWKLIKDNKSLTEQMAMAWRDSTAAQQKLTEISAQKKEMESRMVGFENKIQLVETQKFEFEATTKKKESAASQEIEKLRNLVVNLKKEKDLLQKDMESISRQEDIAREEFNQLIKEVTTGAQAKELNSQVSEDGEFIQIWHDLDSGEKNDNPVE